MKKIYIRNKLCIAVLLNFIFLLLVLLFCDMKYEVSDDYMMDAVLSGALGGNYDAHLLFSNILYGYFLKGLYILLPKISWYFVCQILICFLSLCAVTYIILEKNDIIPGVLLSILFVSFFSDDLYILVQFTKTAAAAVCAGGALFLYGLWAENPRKKCMICGGMLTIIGSLIRFSCIYISLVFIFMIFIKCAWDNKSHPNFKKVLFRNLIISLSLLTITIGAYFIDSAIWNHSASYSNYRHVNSLRAYAVDTPYSGYESIAKQLKNIGIDETDYYMIYSWDLLDRDVYSDQKLQQFGDLKTEYHASAMSSKKQLIKNFLNRGYQSYTVVFGIFIMLFVLLFLSPRRFPWALTEVLITALLLMYFFARGRVVYRVEYSIFLCLAISLVTDFHIESITESQKKSCIILCILLGVCKLPLYIPDNNYKTMTNEQYAQYISDTFYRSYDFNVKKYRCDVSHRRPQAELIDYIESDDENYYLMDFSSTIQLIYYNYKPWERTPKGYWNNYAYLGSVTFGFPSNDFCWEENGIDTRNPNKSLVNKNILVIDNKFYDTKLEYLKKYYYPNVQKELVDTIDGYNIWRYSDVH